MTSEVLQTKLHSLVIFRNLLQNPVIQKLDVLLCAPSENTLKLADAYGAFTAALFTHTTDWSQFLMDSVLEDENLYIHAYCQNLSADKALQDCLDWELDFLQELSLFSPEQVPLEDKPALWSTHAIPFAATYHQRLKNLPQRGYGIFARHHVFTVNNGELVPVKHPDPQSLAQLSGYEQERNQVIANTRALLAGKPASNVLLYGDAGTGKSSTVKAIANEFASEGLRLIEVKKAQLYQIPDIVERLSLNPLKFILFIDDLSFSSNDNDFSALKAILEGSVSSRGKNLAIYATSNRRHLIKESFADRDGDEIHLADTMQELLSLSARFGLTVTFSRPDKTLYQHIVENLAVLYDLSVPKDQLLAQAETFALRAGGRSPRTAKQFIEQLKARENT